jgi:hypothetical protein
MTESVANDPIPDDESENEVLRETRLLQQQKDAATNAAQSDKSGKRPVNWKTAAGIGIGSAAVLAALIYANRDKN